jgi:hypothetical protein
MVEPIDGLDSETLKPVDYAREKPPWDFHGFMALLSQHPLLLKRYV